MCICIIGPGAQPPTVRTSGTDVDQVLTSFPANISFMINDDLAALEDMEMYTLTLIPSDPSITINQATKKITILDNDGKLHHLCRLMGFWLYTHIYCRKCSYRLVYICFFSSAGIFVGFPYKEITFDASAVGNATMLVFGEALKSFTVDYVHGIYITIDQYYTLCMYVCDLHEMS